MSSIVSAVLKNAVPLISECQFLGADPENQQFLSIFPLHPNYSKRKHANLFIS